MVEINLLPKQYRKTGETNTWQYASIGLGLLTLLLIGIPELMIGGIINSKQKQYEDQQAQITNLQQTMLPQYNELVDEKTKLGLVDQTVQALTATKTSYWSTDLANFVNNMPAGNPLHLTALTISEPAPNTANTPAPNGKTVQRTFDLTGVAESTNAVIGFLNSYEQNNYGVNFKSANHDEAQDNYNFSALVQQYTPTAASTQTAPTTTPAGGTPAAEPAPAAPAAPANSGGNS